MLITSIHNALDNALQQESDQSYFRSIKIHEEDFYIIGASQALMVVFDKNPDRVEVDIRMAVRTLELEEE